ncbi:LacI family DNA-binding transcriptional regulator [Dactylosporangium matsuzakiense]|uniref:Transcriptional regulator n=1 Tax=Dactylosporangium matsuzakiense TaxID=53360 RepID=A0A9W6KRS9_9ACTN|nr:LacI family DNA-binding transcriptional regulator [Dactylosporangium matsuzakiense]UWZ48608.1 LacI family DNA-binding transcriptional regulator [Dactylosporangium matsuzakiense]GLL06443.1 transcriptional regulator [Dactylosporangium matsuzakiense]
MSARRRGEVTVAAIAQLAGVSVPTVSKVLNGRAGIAAETRDRVEALLREHGYRRADAATTTPNIEVAFFGLESHLAMEILRGVEQTVRERGLAVGFTDLQGPAPAGRRPADRLLARRPTGVIAVNSAFRARHYEQLIASGVPMVVLDPTGEPSHAIPSVGATNWSGGVAATRHLLDLGHRRIAVITGPLEYLCARARLEASRGALETAGHPLDPALLRHGRFTFDDGVDLARELLSAADRPTAVVCGDDLQALGVYEAARRLGLRIPDDLSVVGFDDIEVTRWCGPPMTTVRQPFAEMGATAARMVLQLAMGEPVEPARVELATELIVRGSTAPI